MSSILVQPVTTKSQRKAFLNLPWSLYKDDPNWIPPLRDNQAELVGFKKHAFYDNAKTQAFLATKNGDVVGRISGVVNHPHNDRFKEKRGFFGFFESIDDPQVACGLLDAATSWLKLEGMTELRGPCNPSQNYECGLLVDGFDSPPTLMMTYNHSYYEKLIAGWGLEKSQDLYSFWGHTDMIESLDKKMAFVIEEAKRRFDITLRRMDTRNFKAEVRMFLDIYNQSLIGTWGFAPFSETELDQLGGSLKHLIVPEMTAIAEIKGRAVGSVIGLLDYNPRIKLIDGRLFPFGFIRLLWNRKKIKRVRLLSTNVLPEYQKWGVGLVLMSRLVPEIFDWGIEEAEFSWVLESNHLSRATLERGGAQINKTFRLYDKTIG